MPTRRRLIAGERRTGRPSSAAPAPAPTAEEVEAAIAADTSPSLVPAPTAPEAVEEAPAADRSEPSGVVPVLVIALAVLTVVALVAFGILAFRAAQASATDRARTAAVAAAREAIVPVLSYDYRRLDADFKKASSYLTGSFAAEYAQTTSTVVRPTATQTHAVVTATIRTAAVVSATPDRVVTLVFVNQTTTSNRLKEPNTDFNRVRITLDRVNGRWLISDIDAL